ncbi:hypothetical protein [Branchiibius sp. NY16-3462-2]|uniref:hypothetical protein n=1 Tax=Branchiibius sp. NY16-3462-2 TaxID=1807500 RepID=UPI0007974084|nr:hypothetical protein [Branchiibius sp. NY16-3462-2]KYH43121.1 hypothetical protein AZH51_01335 [Branchiibius sp. NY16-3462-2]
MTDRLADATQASLTLWLAANAIFAALLIHAVGAVGGATNGRLDAAVRGSITAIIGFGLATMAAAACTALAMLHI